MKNLQSLNGLLLFLLGAVLLWSGCDPMDDEDPMGCDDNVTQINYGDYCNPRNNIFEDLAAVETAAADLPDACFTDYTSSRIVKIDVPAGGIIYLHQFFSFPGEVTTEFFGTNCDGGFTLLNACDPTSRVVEVFEVDASGFTTVYIRVVYRGLGSYVPGSRETDRIILAAFSEAPVFNTIIGANGEDVPLSCDGRTTQRIILTPGDGNLSPLEVALASGLPVKTCECANGELVTIEVPPGVDLNTTKPIVKENPPDIDTVKTTPDFIVPIPQLVITDQIDPANVPYIAGNACLNYQAPITGANGAPVIVTIVDSGADLDNQGDAFSQVAFGSSETGCSPQGIFGFDVLNGDDTPEDEVGHGTAVAGAVMSGYNSSSPLILLHNKFFGPDGGTLFDALCASHAGIELGTDILTLSWGFPAEAFPVALENLIDRAASNEIIVVASAGNDAGNIDFAPYWPASAAGVKPNVITVSSYEGPIELVPSINFWSNFGPATVEVAALYTTETLQLGGGVWYPVGTSISAPIVSRRLAQIKAQSPGSSAFAVIDEFLKNEAVTQATLAVQIKGGKFLPQPNPALGCQLEQN
ncbi:MAG: S8 family serine peptidase [Bacteroidota bacterium]